MQYDANSPQEYIDMLPGNRKSAMTKLREVIKENIPEGFSETINYGMIGFVVPHSLYPKGYHCDPTLPLPFLSIASQKNFIAVYHMGLYADKKLMDWFLNEYSKYVKTKPDMGKSCIRFKKIDNIPYELIGQLAGKVNVAQWIQMYEAGIR